MLIEYILGFKKYFLIIAALIISYIMGIFRGEKNKNNDLTENVFESKRKENHWNDLSNDAKLKWMREQFKK